MPIYEFQEGSKIVERVLSVAERDKFPGRVTAPRRVLVCPRGETSQPHAVMNGLRKQEEKYGSAFSKMWPFSVKQTREAWGKNRATDN
jgi:hypothetical protein